MLTVYRLFKQMKIIVVYVSVII